MKQPHVDKVEGGFGTASAIFLKALFSGPNDLRNGISLQTPDGPLMLFIDFGRVLADTAGLKYIFDCTGASGHKPCMHCRNVVNCHGGLDIPDDGAFVDHACHEPSRFATHSKRTMRKLLVDVAAGPRSRAEQTLVTRRLGFKHNPHGVLFCAELQNVVTTFDARYDFAHTILTNGTAGLEVSLLVDAYRAAGIVDATGIVAAFAGWHWPTGLQKKQKIEELNDMLFIQGSDVLSVYPVLRHLLTSQFPSADEVRLEKLSYLAMCRFLDEYSLVQRGWGHTFASRHRH